MEQLAFESCTTALSTPPFVTLAPLSCSIVLLIVQIRLVLAWGSGRLAEKNQAIFQKIHWPVKLLHGKGVISRVDISGSIEQMSSEPILFR
jgi:hypothetical protein